MHNYTQNRGEIKITMLRIVDDNDKIPGFSDPPDQVRGQASRRMTGWRLVLDVYVAR